MAVHPSVRDFPAAEFRAGIELAMTMGAAPAQEDRCAFHFAKTTVYAGAVDDEGVPLDPAATSVVTARASVRVPCAMQYLDAAGQVTAFGDLVPARLILTLLDIHQVQVEGFHHVVVNGHAYAYESTEPPRGLFDVGIFTHVCVAMNSVPE